MSRACSMVVLEYITSQRKVSTDPNIFYLQKSLASQILVYHASEHEAYLA